MADYNRPTNSSLSTSTPRRGTPRSILKGEPIATFSNPSIVTDEHFIAVMGKSGTGKSTFINLASSSALRISGGLESCTEKVELSLPFFLEGRCIRLIDTPGFDDSSKSDTEILNTIASFFASEYSSGRKLAGIIYLHSISSTRMGAIAQRNLVMFEKLCGRQALQNVALITTRWDEVQIAVGEAREQELCNKLAFFKPILNAGASLFRHDRTLSSCQKIVRHLLTRLPVPLRVQTEMVDKGKLVSETAAGIELQRELHKQLEVHEGNMRALKEELAELNGNYDKSAAREVEEEMQALQQQVTRIEAEARKLATLKPAPPSLRLLISSATPADAGASAPQPSIRNAPFDYSAMPPLPSNVVPAVLTTASSARPVNPRLSETPPDAREVRRAHSHGVTHHRERRRLHSRHRRRDRRSQLNANLVWDGWGDFRILFFVIALLILVPVFKKIQSLQY